MSKIKKLLRKVWLAWDKPERVIEGPVFVPWADADRMIRKDPAWVISPKEDNNRLPGLVWIEKRERILE